MNQQIDTTSTRAPLWFAFFAGPLAWTLHELVSYVLVKAACEAGVSPLLHVVSLGALALAAAGEVVAGRISTREPRPSPDSSSFLAAAAQLTNAVFIFAIVLESIPNLVVSPCL
jgi:hypothetical protein